jgi:hypothetical protein
MEDSNGSEHFLSFRQYARHRGCSPQAVSDAVAQLRISVVKVTKNGKVVELIDPEVADVEWNQNTRTQFRNRQAELKFSPEEDEDEEESDQAASSINFGPGNPPSLIESRAWSEAYKAKISQVEYERAVKAVLPTDKVEQVWTKILSTFRARMLGIPPKIAPQLQGLESVVEIEKIIKDQIYEALNELSEFDLEDYSEEVD